jgi:hypothetical protein
MKTKAVPAHYWGSRTIDFNGEPTELHEYNGQAYGASLTIEYDKSTNLRELWQALPWWRRAWIFVGDWIALRIPDWWLEWRDRRQS